MHWRFEDLVAHVSRCETLYPGEILGSGTVGGGCGAEQMRFLSPGDTIELEVNTVGSTGAAVHSCPDSMSPVVDRPRDRNETVSPGAQLLNASRPPARQSQPRTTSEQQPFTAGRAV